MDEAAIDEILLDCEAALTRPGKVPLARFGFWKAVAAVKRHQELADAFAVRIGHIDREAFLRNAGPFVFPANVGIWVLVVGTGIGIALVAAAPSLVHWFSLTGAPWIEILFLAGTAALIGSTHGLAHWIVGTALGMDFTHWYSRPPKSPQPGFKVDYTSYLRTPPRSRAWMHASGAIVTKVVPFVAILIGLFEGIAAWAIVLLLAIGILQFASDYFLSVRASDWKKFRREMRFA